MAATCCAVGPPTAFLRRRTGPTTGQDGSVMPFPSSSIATSTGRWSACRPVLAPSVRRNIPVSPTPSDRVTLRRDTARSLAQDIRPDRVIPCRDTAHSPARDIRPDQVTTVARAEKNSYVQVPCQKIKDVSEDNSESTRNLVYPYVSNSAAFQYEFIFLIK